MQVRWILPTLVAAGLLTVGCGGSSSTGSTSDKTTTSSPERFVLQPSEAPTGFKVSTAPSTGSMGPEGPSRTFGDAAAIATKTMRPFGSSDYTGPSDSELVSDAYVFATPGDAKAVWSGFVGASGGNKTLATPAGAPGDQKGLYQTSFSSGAGLGTTYLFREGNVLSQVELDGKPNQFSVSELIALANKQSAHIKSTLK